MNEVAESFRGAGVGDEGEGDATAWRAEDLGWSDGLTFVFQSFAENKRQIRRKRRLSGERRILAREQRCELFSDQQRFIGGT